MSKLLKELEAGENQERLGRLLQEAQGLERSSRKARKSSSGLSDPPDSPVTPPRRDRRSNQSSIPTGQSPLGKISAGKLAVGKSPLGKGLLPSSRSGTPQTSSEPKKIKIHLRVSSSGQAQSPRVPPTTTTSYPAVVTPEPEARPSMASQRNRPGRGGPRGATNDLTEEKDLWQQILPHLAALSKAEARAAEVNKEIFENEVQKKEKANAGISIFFFITHQEQS
jgi:hypothetical protein